MDSFYAKADEIIRGRQPAALCIVVASGASTPGKEGAKMIVYPNGTIYGTIGGGAIEKEVIGIAIRMIYRGKPARISFNLDHDLGMHCGGVMEVYIEPLMPLPRLLIFGAGHIGKALSKFAGDLGFSVTLVDPREEIAREEWTKKFSFIQMDYLQAAGEVDLDDRTNIVIVTPKHIYDEEILALVARRPHGYLGMIGSREKIARLKKRFLEEGILTAAELDAVDMPIGINFRAETPAEIAISILAKLIDVRNTPVEATEQK
jgi:xanthine dehydrogenase accessory factor